jgi:hypothetical protein
MACCLTQPRLAAAMRYGALSWGFGVVCPVGRGMRQLLAILPRPDLLKGRAAAYIGSGATSFVGLTRPLRGSRQLVGQRPRCSHPPTSPSVPCPPDSVSEYYPSAPDADIIMMLRRTPRLVPSSNATQTLCNPTCSLGSSDLRPAGTLYRPSIHRLVPNRIAPS